MRFYVLIHLNILLDLFFFRFCNLLEFSSIFLKVFKEIYLIALNIE
jgi:hypothetical protein